MTELQLALIAGTLLAAGPVVLIMRYAPRHPALGAELEVAGSSAGVNNPTTTGAGVVGQTAEDRLGFWLQRRLGARIQVPQAELEMLRIPPHRFLAQKATFAAVGLMLPTVMSVLLYLLGVPMPIGIPVVGSLLLAVVLSFIPDYNVRDNARKARAEFTYVLGSYMDLVAMERRAGTSPRQALEDAAEVADSWVFQRLAEELTHSRLSGVAPWERLGALGERYMVTELTELGHIMRIAGTESAGVYETLKQRSKAMRKAHLARELTAANETSTKRSAPIALLGLVFLALLVVPALLAMLTMN